MFEKVNIQDLKFNPFDEISNHWLLISAKKDGVVNTMTASWGQLGHLWGKNVMTVYIRPQRYTKEFVDNSEYFTLSFLPEEKREALNVCGRVSGRDVEDKWAEAGLHPYYVDGTTAVEEADLVFVCRKLYAQDMLPECFTDDASDEKWYPKKDYHTMYMAEIVKVLEKQ